MIGVTIHGTTITLVTLDSERGILDRRLSATSPPSPAGTLKHSSKIPPAGRIVHLNRRRLSASIPHTAITEMLPGSGMYSTSRLGEN